MIDHHILEVFFKLALFLEKVVDKVFFNVLVERVLLRVVLIIKFTFLGFCEVGCQVALALDRSAVGE